MENSYRNNDIASIWQKNLDKSTVINLACFHLEIQARGWGAAWFRLFSACKLALGQFNVVNGFSWGRMQ